MKNVANTDRKLCLLKVVATAIAFITTAESQAQTLEEVVVTAQKREQSLQDVGISITAITGNAMRELGITSVEILEEQVPGLMMVNTGAGSVNTLPSIRGVSQNDYSTHQEMPNAIYLDGVYVSNPAAIGFSIFDMARVEVLRGPQGTLYGRNATGGLVHFVTEKPTDTLEAYVDGTVSDTNGTGWRSEAMVSGPISDAVRARLSGFYETSEGYWENTAPNGKDAFEIDEQWAVRGQMDFDLTERLTIALTSNVGRLEPSREGMYFTVPAYVDPVTGFGVEIDANNDPGDIFGYGGNPNAVNGVCAGCDFFGQRAQEVNKGEFNSGHIFLEKENYSYTSDINWELSDRIELTSITNYQDFKFDYNEDCDGSIIDYCRFPFGTEQDQWSQELRLNGEQGPLTWQGGLYYIEVSQKNKVGFDGAEGFTYSILNTFDQDMDSWAVFSQLEYALSEQWKVIGGLRWTDESKSIDSLAWNSPDVFYPDGSIQFVDSLLVYDYNDSRSEDDWSGKIGLDYTPDDDLLLYGTISRGTKGGGYNGNGGGLDNASLDSDIEFNGETLINYETGFKSTISDGMARLNGSVFYYDYQNYQSFEVRNSLASFVTNKDATFYGGELEISVVPAEGWTTNLGLSLLDTKVRDITLPNGSVEDRESAVAPPFSMNGVVRKEWGMFDGTMAAQFDFNYVDQYYASVFNQAATEVPDYIVTNARFSYNSGNDKWNIALFAQNLADSQNQSYAFDFASFGINLKMYNPPRTIGIQYRYNWM